MSRSNITLPNKSLGLTSHSQTDLLGTTFQSQTEVSSRPERSVVEGPAVSFFSHTVHPSLSSQNLKRSDVSRLRIGLGASGRPNCVLFTVVFHPVNTG